MPIPFHRTKKGQAKRYIQQNAQKWVTLDSVETATGLPRRAIRDAMEELLVNNVVRKRGAGRQSEYRFTKYFLERNGWIYQGKDLVYPEDAANA